MKFTSTNDIELNDSSNTEGFASRQLPKLGPARFHTTSNRLNWFEDELLNLQTAFCGEKPQINPTPLFEPARALWSTRMHFIIHQ